MREVRKSSQSREREWEKNSESLTESWEKNRESICKYYPQIKDILLLYFLYSYYLYSESLIGLRVLCFFFTHIKEIFHAKIFLLLLLLFHVSTIVPVLSERMREIDTDISQQFLPKKKREEARKE